MGGKDGGLVEGHRAGGGGGGEVAGGDLREVVLTGGSLSWHSLVSTLNQSEGRRSHLTNQNEILSERNTFCYACLVISSHFISIH